MPRDLAKKAETMRKWRAGNKVRIRVYEDFRRARRYALARARHKRKPEQAQRQRERHAAWLARNPNYLRDYYRENLAHYTGDGKWATRAVRGRAAFRAWTRVLAASRARLSHPTGARL